MNRSAANESKKSLAVFAVQEIAHRGAPGLVRFALALTIESVGRTVGCGINRFGLATGWTAIGEAGLIRLQLEFF